MAERTLEQRIKFDHGLSIGRSLVQFTRGDRAITACVEIRPRGSVYVLVKPKDTDMYTSWSRLRGDNLSQGDGAIIVWAARNPELMAELFSGDHLATIPV